MKSEKEPKTVGERIKFLREKNGESQKELGDALGLTQNSISKLENDKTALMLEHQIRIAEHFNVSHDYLITGRDSDSILELLKKYVSIEFRKISEGTARMVCPVMKINKAFFRYLFKIARVEGDADIPVSVREVWIKEEKEVFYNSNRKNDFLKVETIVPLPPELIYPDEQKDSWKQSDLLRELNNFLLDGTKKAIEEETDTEEHK